MCRHRARAGVVYSRGYGRSAPVPDVRVPRPAGPTTHREVWDVLPIPLAQLGIARPVLVGHSDGGTIALPYASATVSICVVMAPHVIVEDVSSRPSPGARGLGQRPA